VTGFNIRDTQSIAPLSDREAAYLQTGDPGGYESYKLENRIENKAEDIPRRFLFLLQDIGLLHEGDYLDELELWSQISGPQAIAADNHFITTFEDETDDHHVLTDGEARDMDILFGRDLGIALKLLVNQADEGSELRKIIWGLILANIAPPSGTPEQEREQYNELMEYFQELADEHFEHGRYPRSIERRKEIDEWIRECMEKKEVELTDPLRNKIFKQASVKPDPSKSEVNEIMEGTLASHPLQELEPLRKALIEDYQQISDVNYRGVRIEAIFNALWEKEKQGKEAREKLDTNNAQNLVTTILNRSSRSDTGHGDTSTHYFSYPIVEGDMSGWELTEYGWLFCYFLFEEQADSEWFHAFVMNPAQMISES